MLFLAEKSCGEGKVSKDSMHMGMGIYVESKLKTKANRSYSQVKNLVILLSPKPQKMGS